MGLSMTLSRNQLCSRIRTSTAILSFGLAGVERRGGPGAKAIELRVTSPGERDLFSNQIENINISKILEVRTERSEESGHVNLGRLG